MWQTFLECVVPIHQVFLVLISKTSSLAQPHTNESHEERSGLSTISHNISVKLKLANVFTQIFLQIIVDADIHNHNYKNWLINLFLFELSPCPDP